MKLTRLKLLLGLIALAFPGPVFQAWAKDTPLQTVDWPATGTPIVRFTFGKFKEMESSGRLHGYLMDTKAQNLSSKPIQAARFSVYLFDKNKVRVGEDLIQLDNVAPGETVRFQTSVAASGTPVSVSVVDSARIPRTVSLTVNSSPQGAGLKVDGADSGTTPRTISLGLGKHILTFSKEGFNAGNFPVEITAQDASGGSITYEMGTATFDTVELRDGSVLSGDLVSIAGMDVQMRIGGSIQHIDRNKIKRVLLTQRDSPQPALPPAASDKP